MLKPLRILATVVFVGSLTVLVTAKRHRDRLPLPAEIDPTLRRDPVQTPTVKGPFELERGGIIYAIKPLFEYDLAGLVVSCFDTSTWGQWGRTYTIL